MNARTTWIPLAALAACLVACGARPATVAARDCSPGAAFARPGADPAVLNKLDPRLIHLVHQVEAGCRDAEVEVIAWFTGSIDDLVAAGLVLGWRDRYDRGIWFATGRIAPSRLVAFAAIDHVLTVEVVEDATPELTSDHRRNTKVWLARSQCTVATRQAIAYSQRVSEPPICSA